MSPLFPSGVETCSRNNCTIICCGGEIFGHFTISNFKWRIIKTGEGKPNKYFYFDNSTISIKNDFKIKNNLEIFLILQYLFRKQLNNQATIIKNGTLKLLCLSPSRTRKFEKVRVKQFDICKIGSVFCYIKYVRPPTVSYLSRLF